MSSYIIDYPEEWSTFEGLSKPVRLILKGDIKKPGSWPYCVISGNYRVGKNVRGMAIAIGLWDEERNCFSVLKKMKDGKSLPLPFRVKADKADAEAERILRNLGGVQKLEDLLERYKEWARANQ